MRKIGLALQQACLLISLRNCVDLHDRLTVAQIGSSAKRLPKKRLVVETNNHRSGYQLTDAGVQAAIAAEYIGWKIELAARKEWREIQAEMELE